MTHADAVVRRKPGPVPSLSRDEIIELGLEILAREGLRAVSFRAIALRLGVAPNALYTYVADKDDLIAGMFAATLRAVDLPDPDRARSPEDQLVALMTSLRTVLIANAGLMTLASGTSASVDSAASAFDHIWTILTRLVPDEQRAAALYQSLVDLTLGSALTTAREQAGRVQSERLMAGIDKTAHSPAIAMTDALSHNDRDQLFEQTLRLLITALS